MIGGWVMLGLFIAIGLPTRGGALVILWPLTMLWGAVAASDAHTKHVVWLTQQGAQFPNPELQQAYPKDLLPPE